jgi:two-component system NtrC family response regulator
MLSFSVVVIDDDSAQREILSGFLKKEGCQVFACESGEKGVQEIEKRYVDVVITDFRMPGMNGLEVLKQVKQLNPEIQVIILTAYGTVEDAVTAMQTGAWDYLSKPVDLEELELKLKKLANHRTLLRENQILRSQLSEDRLETSLVYQSHVMEKVLNLVARVSKSNAAVLIQGESGTGKEVIAKLIHQSSPRKDGPFMAVNCAAIPETLFESELFGHEKGAFTGAYERRPGRIEIARGGTLFFDEVADIPLNFQVKLLRVIQEKEFQRLGATQLLKSDVRILSATNRNIQELVEREEFRSDLFFRLNVIPILIPPLRERREDIPALIEHFINKHATQNSRELKGISSEGLNQLVRYDFPGNVRELENIIERAVILARHEYITTDDLPLQRNETQPVGFTGSLMEQVEQLEVNLIRVALLESHGIQTEAAKKLGISERMLRYKLKKYDIGQEHRQ